MSRDRTRVGSSRKSLVCDDAATDTTAGTGELAGQAQRRHKRWMTGCASQRPEGLPVTPCAQSKIGALGGFVSPRQTPRDPQVGLVEVYDRAHPHGCALSHLRARCGR